MAKVANVSPFQAMEDEAYQAFREWPIFLVMRQKELETHLVPIPSLSTPLDTAAVANDESQSVEESDQ